MIKGGFSLIELLVVIALIGIIAAVAVPAYQAYIIRSKVSQQVSYLANLLQPVLLKYEKGGALPTTMQIGTVTLPVGAWGTVANKNIQFAAPILGSNYFMVIASIPGLPQFTGYVDPALNSDEAVSRFSEITVAFRVATNGTVEWNCGPQQGAVSSSVPADYRPTSCRCTNILTWAGGGSC